MSYKHGMSSRERSFNFKSIRGTVIYIIVILVILAGGYLIYDNFLASIFSNEKNQTVSDVSAVYDYPNVYDIARNKGAQAGQDVLDDVLKRTKDAEQQAKIYLDKSSLIGSENTGNDKNKALEYANKAESLYPNTGSALGIAKLEERLGNIQNSVKYYKIYLERLKKIVVAAKSYKEGEYGDTYNHYLSHTNELEESIK